ncbi:type IV pilus modification PilV family protein [Pseudoalteromonas spongiae]|uniref:type IV pilus modification PilV family protein n=1 Tax=Pseudoalteromonas spongiae TaxID=298657 RepID=UPI000C2CEB7F|nr:prepilin-type N-terminal cleavage/methylation domain-containing protein [Pseudoalteromonas spongiae]TMO87487.1 prepilin-type N-terminal cleavage/methylation domain-containing protein [Pseudoalteromonas spongiae]
MKLHKKQSGFSLVEAMVATVVSAIALLSLGVGQVKSLQYAASSLDYTLSLIQANNAVEQSWANLCDLQNGNIELADLDVAAQTNKYTVEFPNGFDIDDFEVLVSWNDERMTDNLANSAALQVKLPRVCS